MRTGGPWGNWCAQGPEIDREESTDGGGSGGRERQVTPSRDPPRSGLIRYGWEREAEGPSLAEGGRRTLTHPTEI